MLTYRIGSFNLRNLGFSVFDETNKRDLKKIADIIRGENFDVVALQEVLSEGKAFTLGDFGFAKKSILMELGRDQWDFEWAYAGGENDWRYEGYAFIWNKKRLRLCTTNVVTPLGIQERTFYPRMLKISRNKMLRMPYYARFTANGLPGGTNVEFRLICIHTYFGKNDDERDRAIRQRELDILLKEIYPQITDRRYGYPMTAYTILLGDYNAELWTTDSSKWLSFLNNQKRFKPPAIMNTDLNGEVVSEKYNGRKIKTVQYELTTLKRKPNGKSGEVFDSGGFANSYDHFSYETDKFKDVKIHVKRIREAVTKYCKPFNGDYNSDFEKYYTTISDHIPIMMEIELR